MGVPCSLFCVGFEEVVRGDSYKARRRGVMTEDRASRHNTFLHINRATRNFSGIIATRSPFLKGCTAIFAA